MSAMDTSDRETGGFRLNGWHVLAIFVAFFGVVFAVNAVMVYKAVGTFPGAVTPSSYSASQNYNGEIAAAEAQAALGWRVDENLTRDADGRAVLALSVADRAGAPIDGLAVDARLQHPVKQGEDVHGKVEAAGAGRYVARFDGVEAGLWTLAIEARRGDARVWRSENRAVLH